METLEPKKNKDASIEIIDNILIHDNADKLEICIILGFECITEKALYNVGDKIIYIRPDSLLPIESWTEGYRKYSPKRIKSVNLRSRWSRGIIVPFSILPSNKQVELEKLNIGADVAELLGVTHWVEPEPQDLQAKGGLPYGIPKTDETLYENIKSHIPYGEICDIDLKVDGQSSTYFYVIEDDRFGITGRTQELHEIFTNNYTNQIARYDLKNKLISYCKKHNVSIAIRGESYGVGIQKNENNPHSKLTNAWAMFSVWLINEREHAEKGHPHYFRNVAKELDLPTVDLLEENVIFSQEHIDKYANKLTKINGNPFEGVVVKHAKGSFKIINNTYDSKK